MHVHINFAQLSICAIFTIVVIQFLNLIGMHFQHKSNAAASYCNLMGVN